MRMAFFISLLFSVLPASAASLDSLPASATPVSVSHAAAGDVALVVWELGNGDIEGVFLDRKAEKTLSANVVFSDSQDGARATRPTVAALLHEGTPRFLVAWHQEVLGSGGVATGTRVAARGVTLNGEEAVLGEALTLDGSENPSVSSEERIVPTLVGNDVKGEFALFWGEWIDGRAEDHPHFLFGARFDSSGALQGEIVLIDDQAPLDDDGFPVRMTRRPIFSAAQVTADGDYLIAWSDPEFVGSAETVYTKLVPADIASVGKVERNPIDFANHNVRGTGKLSLSRRTDGAGWLLAYEDARGTGPMDGIFLNDDGSANGDSFRLMNLAGTGTGQNLLSPGLLVRTQDAPALLFTLMGEHSLSDPDLENLQTSAPPRLVWREVAMDSPGFVQGGTVVKDIRALEDNLSVIFSPQAYAASVSEDGEQVVVFTIGGTGIDLHRLPLADQQPPTPDPPTPGEPQPEEPETPKNNGGGAMVFLSLLALLCRSRRAVFALGVVPAVASAAPPDLELLHTRKDDEDCYRVVMYREVTEIRIGKSWGKTPIPVSPPAEITALPGGWRGDVKREGAYQYIELKPAPFDSFSGISIGRLCLKLPEAREPAERISYAYDLAATGSPIMAEARPDDGPSDDELRNMITRGERLKKGDVLEKPKAVKETAKTLKRAKDLFN